MQLIIKKRYYTLNNQSCVCTDILHKAYLRQVLELRLHISCTVFKEVKLFKYLK